MPYIAYVDGIEADLADVASEQHDEATRRLSDLEGWDYALADLEAHLAGLRDTHPGLRLAVAATGEEGELILFRLAGGQLAVQHGVNAAQHARIAGGWVVRGAADDEGDVEADADPTASDDASLLVRGSIKARLAHAGKLARARSAKDITELVDALAHPRNAGATELRQEIYNALSWHETDAVRAAFIDGLRREGPAVVDKMLYVLWRQEQLVESLPTLLLAAWEETPREEHYLDRLARAIRDAEGLVIDEAFIAAAAPALLRRIGREDDAVHRAAQVSARSARPTPPAEQLRQLVRDGGDASAVEALAQSLPLTASLRELLGQHLHDAPLDEARVLWRREATLADARWLPQLGRLIADDGATWSLELLDVEHGTTVAALPRGRRESGVRGCLLDAGSERPRWIGALEKAGPKLCWVSAMRDALRIDATLPIAYGVRNVLQHGRSAVLCASWRGEVLRAADGETLWSFRAPGDDATLCRALGDPPERAFVYSRDGLCCLDGDSGEALWTNPTVGEPRGDTPVLLSARDVYFIDAARAYRLDASDGQTLATLELPEHCARSFAPTPGGVNAALADGGAFLSDGRWLLGDLCPSGTLWSRDGRIEHHPVSLLTHRVLRNLGEHTVEIGPNSVMLPVSAGLLRRRLQQRWFSLPDIELAGPVTDRAVLVQCAPFTAAANSGQWLAIEVY
ncbi:MAG: PQQ-like beta-propeller repeat protein [Myxococcales bacterium]|nr:PQQ-like beta-propeller repeat protein [Myxococcales bacterium]